MEGRKKQRKMKEQGVSDAFVGGVAGGEGCLYTNDNQIFFYK